MNALLADVVLVLHAALACFVVAGLPLVAIGHVRQWRWIDDWRFRAAHLAAIATIALEAWCGIDGPLTTLEDRLRGAATGEGFVEHWVRRALFFSAPPWVFTCAYTVFALGVLATWWLHPPRRRPVRELPVHRPATACARDDAIDRVR